MEDMIHLPLSDLIHYYTCAREYVNRMGDYESEEYKKGYLTGSYRMIHSLMLENVVSDLPELEAITEEDIKNFKSEQGLDLVYKIKFLDKYYGIYLDDYGQCYTINIGDDFFSCGTYNFDIQEYCVMEIFHTIYVNDIMNIGGEI